MFLYNKVKYVQCYFCKRFVGKKIGISALLCEAFEEKIPKDILLGEFIHTKVHPKQKNKILFESITKEK